MNAHERPAPAPTLWRVADVALFLACSVTLVYRLKDHDGLPYFRVRGALRFDPVAVRQWLEARKEGN